MNITAQLQSLLFVASKPVTAAELAKALGASAEDTAAGLTALETELGVETSGLRLMKHADKFSLTTAPEATPTVKKFLRADTAGDLTRPALETLTIIAYRGPITRPEIEQIRGVNCSLILRNLLVRGLIEETQNQHNEQIYALTHAFMSFLGITKVETLPDYETLRHHPELEKALEQLAAVTAPAPTK